MSILVFAILAKINPPYLSLVKGVGIN